MELFILKLVGEGTGLALLQWVREITVQTQAVGNSRGVFTWLLYMLTPPWDYAARDARLPQVAASPRPLDLPTVNPLETSYVLFQSQTKNKWIYKLLEEKKPNRKGGRKQPGSRNKGVRYTDTKPAQLSKHDRGSSPPVGVVVAEIWVRQAREREQEPGVNAGILQGHHFQQAGPWESDALFLHAPVSLTVQFCFESLYYLLRLTSCWSWPAGKLKSPFIVWPPSQSQYPLHFPLSAQWISRLDMHCAPHELVRVGLQAHIGLFVH